MSTNERTQKRRPAPAKAQRPSTVIAPANATQRTRVARPLIKDDPAAILQHWREAVPNDRLAHLVKDATRLLHRALQVRLAQHDVSFGHWTFLRILWEQDGLTQRELSNAAGLMEPTTHAALNAMEKLGFVRRHKLEGDQRNLHIFLTPAGKKIKARLVPHAIAVNAAAVSNISAADIATTRRVLLGIIENLARQADA